MELAVLPVASFTLAGIMDEIREYATVVGRTPQVLQMSHTVLYYISPNMLKLQDPVTFTDISKCMLFGCNIQIIKD